MNGLEGLEDLRAALRGNLLVPGDVSFAKRTSEVWAVSGASLKLTEPALIVQPRGEPARRCSANGGHPFGVRPESPCCRPLAHTHRRSGCKVLPSD